MEPLRLFTIGFAGKSAEQFFTVLQQAGVQRLFDIRLNNTSQLAGFTKKEDLRFFLKQIAHIEYRHLPQFAPTQEILDAFKKAKGDWATYETAFLELMSARKVEESQPRDTFERACLLCSEAKPMHCHRRLVAEYLQRRWPPLDITHL